VSKHLPTLIEMAQKDVPVLENDILSATGPFQLREICMKLIKLVSYLLHDRILDAYETMKISASVGATPPQPQVVQPPPRVVRPISTPAGLPKLPPLAGSPQPARVPAPPTNVPGDVPIQHGVTNVVITPTGTVAIAPSGARSVLPPGEAVPLEATTDLPPEPPEAPEGVENVVLPPGGGMSSEVLAALAGRSQDTSPK
jgi:hypothetical protein